MVQLLLQHGADVHAKDKGGLVPLHNACSYGHFEVTELLLKVSEVCGGGSGGGGVCVYAFVCVHLCACVCVCRCVCACIHVCVVVCVCYRWTPHYRVRLV